MKRLELQNGIIARCSKFTLAELKGWETQKLVKFYNRLYNITILESEEVTYKETPYEVDREEPYDPAYLEEKEDKNPYKLPESEKRFLRKISILQNKLHREHIHYEWMETLECFRVARYITEYPTYRYVRIYMDDNMYAFGDSNYDYEVDSNISVVLESVKKWINSSLKK